MCVTAVGVGKLNLVLKARVKLRRERIGTMDRSSRRKEAHFSNAECGVRNAELSQSLLTSAATKLMVHGR
ncbi:MAG: hypothetical protein DME22_08215 [Verrucomicrobia bacterium]|nr:MAG: hypothetical protein DME22_08215 [Verrucomicrobiota bacterium]PYJ97317.1 MAG: hypothetical protein DME23_16110 [Verrucomicrobiota bacterium]